MFKTVLQKAFLNHLIICLIENKLIFNALGVDNPRFIQLTNWRDRWFPVLQTNMYYSCSVSALWVIYCLEIITSKQQSKCFHKLICKCISVISITNLFQWKIKSDCKVKVIPSLNPMIPKDIVFLPPLHSNIHCL